MMWTSYDASSKEHWVSVYRQKLAVRFLLKDHGRNMETTSIHDSTAMERAIHSAVDQMVWSINQTEKTR